MLFYRYRAMKLFICFDREAVAIYVREGGSRQNQEPFARDIETHAYHFLFNFTIYHR
jgi:hypothetical protein